MAIKSVVYVNIPELAKFVRVTINPCRPISDIIDQTLLQCNIITNRTFRLFAIGSNCIELDPNETCSTVIMASFESFILTSNRAQINKISFIYEKKIIKSFAFSGDALSSCFKQVLSLFGVSILDSFYIPFNPINQSIISLSSKDLEIPSLIVIKKFTPYSPVFNLHQFSIGERENEISIPYLPSLLFSPQFCTLFDFLFQKRENTIQILPLTDPKFSNQVKIDPFDSNFISHLNSNEQISLLFYLISFCHSTFPSQIIHLVQRLQFIQDPIKKLESINSIISLLPLEIHMLLFLFTRSLGGVVPPEARQSHVSLMHLIFFGDFSENREIEIDFLINVLTFRSLFFILKPQMDQVILNDDCPAFVEDNVLYNALCQEIEPKDNQTPIQLNYDSFEITNNFGNDENQIEQKSSTIKIQELNEHFLLTDELIDRRDDFVRTINERIESINLSKMK